MDRAVAELRQIPFDQLIGAPMKAAIEAQALSAQSSIEFIQKIGFKDTGGDYQPTDMLLADPSKDADAGELRNVTFKYKKKDEDDTVKDFELTVPLLAITPIPYLRIQEMTIDFSAKLTDAIERTTNTSFKLDTNVGGSYSAFWSPIKLDFRVSATFTTQTQTTARSQREYQLTIHVRAVQDEMPSGMSKILDMLEDAIQDVKQ